MKPNVIFSLVFFRRFTVSIVYGVTVCKRNLTITAKSSISADCKRSNTVSRTSSYKSEVEVEYALEKWTFGRLENTQSFLPSIQNGERGLIKRRE